MLLGNQLSPSKPVRPLSKSFSANILGSSAPICKDEGAVARSGKAVDTANILAYLDLSGAVSDNDNPKRASAPESFRGAGSRLQALQE